MRKLKITGNILIILGLIFVFLLAYLEVLPRYSQYAMKKNIWGKQMATPLNKSQRKQKPLKIERKGPDKNQLGVLIIPKIKIEQVVLYDATVSNLSIGPSLIKSTAYPGTVGNSAIAGHRVSHGFPFRNIDKLSQGDKIIFKNSSGQVEYFVKKKFRVVPSDTSVLNKTSYPQITLLACDPPFSAKYRLAVVAVGDFEK